MRTAGNSDPRTVTALDVSGGVKVPLYQPELEVPGEAKLVKVFRGNEVSLVCQISPRRQIRQKFAGVD